MKLEITRLEGRRNDLLLRVERTEIDAALLSVANRAALMALPGMLRHRTATAAEEQGIAGCKITIEEHLRRARRDRRADSRARRGRSRSATATSARTRDMSPGSGRRRRAIFRILEDPCSYPSHSCLTVWRDGGLSIEDLRFDFDADHVRPSRDDAPSSGEIEWATFGQRVLRDGRVCGIDDLAGEFYDARHLLAFDHHREAGERIRQDIYRGYPASFEQNVRGAWQAGVPRARYVHNAVGLSRDALFVMQREGTIEEIGAALATPGRTTA